MKEITEEPKRVRIIRLWKQGRSKRSIAKIVVCSRTYVYSVLEGAGIHIVVRK